MEITWYGRTCFRLKGKLATVIVDPVSKKSGHTLGKHSPDIVAVSRTDATAVIDSEAAGGRQVLDAPGFYEINGVLVTAVATRLNSGQRNVAYSFEVDGIRIVHLGIPETAPSRSTLTELGEVDVLLVPVGNPGSFDAKTAADVIAEIDPPIAIPMDYAMNAQDEQDGLNPPTAFLTETGVSSEPQRSLAVSRGTVPAELVITLLESRG